MSLALEPPAFTPADRRVAHLRRLLVPGAVDVAFEPVVRLEDGELVGYAAQPAFPPVPGLGALPPDVTYAAATAAGLRPQLDAACWRAATTGGAPPAGRLLVIGVAASSLGDPAFEEVGGLLPARTVLALDEPAGGPGRDRLRERLARWVARGAQVAVADSGAGAASLDFVAAVRPDLVTLPARVVAGVHRDPGRRALLWATVAFARSAGARVLAAGVQDEHDAAVLVAAGVDYGRGPWFGPAGPAWPQPARAALATGSRHGRLDEALAAADSCARACAAVAEHLAGLGHAAAVHLERGGRLRCEAARGAWQVVDGLPTAAATTERATARPLHVHGSVAGSVEIRSDDALDGAAAYELERSAAALGARLTALDFRDAPSPGQCLARAVVDLAAAGDAEAVVARALDAATAVSGLGSAMVAVEEAPGAWVLAAARGPLAAAFTALGPEELSAMAASGASSTTTGETAGPGLPGHEGLRRGGAGTLVVAPLRAGGRAGFLAAADPAVSVPGLEDVERLEALAAHTGAVLTIATGGA